MYFNIQQIVSSFFKSVLFTKQKLRWLDWRLENTKEIRKYRAFLEFLPIYVCYLNSISKEYFENHMLCGLIRLVESSFSDTCKCRESNHFA